MFGRRVIPLLAAITVVFSGCGGSSDNSTTKAPVGVAGDWTGTLRQKGIAPFQIAVRLDAVGSGRVAYTGIECGGTWTPKSALDSNPPVITIRERITEGSGGECKGTGSVTLHPRSPSLASPMQYGFNGDGVSSHGLLHRTDAATIRRIFSQAGVNLP